MLAAAPIRVLVAEDSAVTRALLAGIVSRAAGFELVGAVGDGEAALQAVARLRPAVVTMDLHMPRLDGVEATRRIMRELPTPIVVVTASSNVDGRSTFDAIAAGALSVVARPVGPADVRYQERRQALLDELRLMAGVRLVRRIDVPSRPPSRIASPTSPPAPRAPVELIAVGASTGGPAALHRLLGDLPRGFEPPILVVQHIAEGFVDGLVRWLQDAAPSPVVVPRDGDRVAPRSVFIAPDGHHLCVEPAGRIRLRDDAPVDGHRPSATVLFRSVAEAYGPRAMGIVLTGMGRDGADGLLAMRSRGALTLVQDEASCAVFGMPQAALEAGAAGHTVALDAMGRTVAALAARSRRLGVPDA